MVFEFLAALQGAALLVARLFVGSLFLVHGLPKLVGPNRGQMRAGMGQLGIPPGLFDLVGLLEVLGGLALVVGLLTRLAALLLAVEMVGTIVLHVTKLHKAPIPRGYLEAAFRRTRGYLGGWELDATLLAAALLLTAFGAGPTSLDALLRLG